MKLIKNEDTLPYIINLSGEWSLKLLDKPSEELLKSINTVLLPGTLDENHKGFENTEVSTEHLNRFYTYDGAAVFQRNINIPKHWKDKVIDLIMERTRETEVWFDDNMVGRQNSLTTKQVYELTKSAIPGEHKLTIKVDNSRGVMAWQSVRFSHMCVEQTQTNWNGIVGKFELRAKEKIFIEDIQVYPDIANNKIGAVITLHKFIADELTGKIKLYSMGLNNSEKQNEKQLEFKFVLDKQTKVKVFNIDYYMGEKVRLWDEFSPNMYRLYISLDASTVEKSFTGNCELDFGMREFKTNGTQFQINGKTIFLRGKHDACVFPLTGYAAMDVESWSSIFRTAKSYGINHYRFHSWCPPDAAFTAADLLGVYLQPELPYWNHESAFEDNEQFYYFRKEIQTILRIYGNHPSFVMFSWGNELCGSLDRMEELVGLCKKEDSRHLYSIGSNNFLSIALKPRKSDYWTTFWTEGKWNFKESGFGGKHVRGSTAQITRGHINNEPPSTMKDYSKSIEGIEMPVIGHEVGQYQIYPNFTEIKKYTGVLKPVNLEIYQNKMDTKNMLSLADDFQKSSGKLAVLCYREEIEAALRTPGFGGFQLLDLQDYPGQGTALVGILDSFMDTKGLISPEEWKEFCSETVPLLRFKKYTWTNDEIFNASMEVVNYGMSDIKDAIVEWSVKGSSSDFNISGKMESINILQGCITTLGKISFTLDKVVSAEKLIISINITNTNYKNHYNIWVFPLDIDISIPNAVTLKREINSDAEILLERGESLLIIPDLNGLANSVNGAFIPDFWCYTMFKKYSPPGTVGILCDTKHPALLDFPTDTHSDWQWWNLLKNSRPIILDNAPKECKPIVQAIDNVMRQHKLGIIFEAKVGKGNLLVCSIDLLNQLDRPEAKQMFNLLVNYMKSERFLPSCEMSIKYLKNILGTHSYYNDDINANRNADIFG